MKGSAICPVPGKVDSCGFAPLSNVEQPVLLQLDDLESKVCPEPVLIELDGSRQTLHLDLEQKKTLNPCPLFPTS